MKKEEVLELIKDAMRAKDKVRLSILRQVNEEFKKIEVDQRREVTEEDVTTCVKRLIKATGETLEYSRQAATDEERRFGVNEWKRERLKKAGAAMIIPDFSETEKLIDYLEV